jgi:hypothetical protein
MKFTANSVVDTVAERQVSGVAGDVEPVRILVRRGIQVCRREGDADQVA